MTAATRVRGPWVVWAAAMAMLVATLTLTILNSTLDEDPYFIPIAMVMVLGYSTVGAVLASRNPTNPIGWLMMLVGLTFILTGFTSEYTHYTYLTSPRSLPFGAFAALISNVLWSPLFLIVALLALLFPTGKVPGRRWRHLPTALVALSLIVLAGSVLTPGTLDLELGVDISNPFGVQALASIIEIGAAIGWIGIFLGLGLSVAALFVRYRASRGEERQQVRWLAYVAATTAAVIVTGIAAELVLGDSYSKSVLPDVFFIAGFSLIGIGIPVAMGIAVLRHRLYDLDLVVKKTVLYATVAALLSTTFVAIAVVIGRVAGGSDTGAIVAAAAIGVSFWPAVRLARRVADRIVYGRRATPYEVLAEFSDRVGGSYGSEDVLPRMAHVLRDAVGASRATVWLRVGNELRPAGVFPAQVPPSAVQVSDDRLPGLGGDAATEVRDRGELIGALAVTMPLNDPITPSKERLVRDLATQAGLVLRNVRLIEELRASRQRLVAAQDQERRRIERNIHDGAQQQLVSLGVKARLAQAATNDPAKLEAMLVQIQSGIGEAIDDLRDLARGIYPPLLADQGLAAALAAQARKAAVPTTVEFDGAGRYPQDVETAVYFSVLEALQNIAKYAEATSAVVRLVQTAGELRFEVIDDGRGFDPNVTGYGTGLQGMADRLAVVGGEVVVRSEPGRGTTVEGRISVDEGTSQ